MSAKELNMEISASEIVVCLAQEMHIPLIAGFNRAMALETEDRQLDELLSVEGVQGLFAHPEFGFYLLARSGDTVVGSLMITYEWSDWRAGVIWWMQSVYVVPEFRRQGVFKALFSEVRARANADPSVCGIRLYVEQHNQRAKTAYLREGMTSAHYDIFEIFPAGGN